MTDLIEKLRLNCLTLAEAKQLVQDIEALRKSVAEVELAASVRNVKIGKALGDRALIAEARVAELEEELDA